METEPLDLNEVVDAIAKDNTEVIEQVLKYENRGEILTKCKALHMCCVHKSVNVLNLLLKNNITSEINTKRDFLFHGRDVKCTPLELACVLKGAKIANMLLLAGANPNQKVEFYQDDIDVYPIHYASIKLKLDLIKILIEKGADVSKVAVFRDEVGGSGKDVEHFTYNHTALSLALQIAKGKAEHLECIKYLLKSGCDPNTPVDPRDIPLYTAIKKSWFGAVKALLEHGADMNYPGIDNSEMRVEPAVHQAIYNGSIGILQLLFDHGASPNEEPKLGIYCSYGELENPLAFACHLDKDWIVEYLLQQGARPNDICGTLKEYKFNDEPQDYDALIPVPNMVWYLIDSFLWVGDNLDKLCSLFAKYGADFNLMEQKTGLRPLEVLIKKYPIFEIVEVFIENGCDVNLPFRNGTTPLIDILARVDLPSWIIERMRVRWINLFAPHVDNLDLKDQDGESAVYKTVKLCNWECTDALLYHGASLWPEEWFLKRRNILDKEAIKEWKQGNNLKDETYQMDMLQPMYEYFFTNQMTLKFICRDTIRKRLVYKRNIEPLPLPISLKDYLENPNI